MRPFISIVVPKPQEHMRYSTILPGCRSIDTVAQSSSEACHDDDNTFPAGFCNRNSDYVSQSTGTPGIVGSGVSTTSSSLSPQL